MSTSKFSVKTHIFAGQHLREWAGATRHREEDTQYLEAKQYIPNSKQTLQDGPLITILCAGALGFPKETYEPLWDDLLEVCGRSGVGIRSIWIADASNCGASGVLNECSQGDDPSWFDYSRDLLQMVNVFRDDFTLPIIGIGHSIGATTLMHTALMHPRLFASLVVFDPVLGIDLDKAGASLLCASAVRQDIWPLRSAAEMELRSRRAMQSLDPRTLDLYLQFGLRETPTRLYPQPGKFTLTTTKANEAWGYARSHFEHFLGTESHAPYKARAKYPDQHGSVPTTSPFYYSAPISVWKDLSRLRPGVQYVFPRNASVTTPAALQEIVRRTGSGDGGSGGVPEGRVSESTVKDATHLICFEKPRECAEVACAWLIKDLKAWEASRKYAAEHTDNKSINQLALSDEWIRQSKVFFNRVKARKQSQGERSMLQHRAKL